MIVRPRIEPPPPGPNTERYNIQQGERERVELIEWLEQPRDPRGRPMFTSGILGTVLPVPVQMPTMVKVNVPRICGLNCADCDREAMAYRMVN